MPEPTYLKADARLAMVEKAVAAARDGAMAVPILPNTPGMRTTLRQYGEAHPDSLRECFIVALCILHDTDPQVRG